MPNHNNNKKPYEKRLVSPAVEYVEIASEDSFPCSDPPAWIKVIAHKNQDRKK